MERQDGAKSARIILVIETKANRGMGIKGDPVREVTQYWDLKGNLLATADTDANYLMDLSIWESNRLKKIIEDWKATRGLRNN